MLGAPKSQARVHQNHSDSLMHSVLWKKIRRDYQYYRHNQLYHHLTRRYRTLQAPSSNRSNESICRIRTP